MATARTQLEMQSRGEKEFEQEEIDCRVSMCQRQQFNNTYFSLSTMYFRYKVGGGVSRVALI